MDRPPEPRPPRRGDRMSLGALILLVLGVGLGCWLVIEPLREDPDPRSGDFWLIGLGGVLGGASIVGVPLLLWSRRRGPRRRWGPGRLLWFAHGSAAWLLWPPIVYRRLRPPAQPVMGDQAGVAQVCYFYGTPLMAVYVVAALTAGGWLRRRGRGRPSPLPWAERFGLVLGLAWAALGIYVLGKVHGLLGPFR